MNSKQWEFPTGWPETKAQRDGLSNALLDRMTKLNLRSRHTLERAVKIERGTLTRPELGQLARKDPTILAERIALRWPVNSKMWRLIERDGLNCHWCGRWCNPFLRNCSDLFPTMEHVIRLADGGSNGMHNLKVACRKCNNTRHNKDWKPPRP